MQIRKSDRYSLKADVTTLSEQELRDIKFGLNYRWMAHLKKGHTDAAKSAKDLSNVIRQELAARAQERHLTES